jgi:hypothetical protein
MRRWLVDWGRTSNAGVPLSNVSVRVSASSFAERIRGVVSDHVQGSGQAEAGPDGVQDSAVELGVGLGVGFAVALAETWAAGADPHAENIARRATRGRCWSARLAEVTLQS